MPTPLPTPRAHLHVWLLLRGWLLFIRLASDALELALELRAPRIVRASLIWINAYAVESFVTLARKHRIRF
jgi:hypothetical protein